jgi:hypothetical protein
LLVDIEEMRAIYGMPGLVSENAYRLETKRKLRAYHSQYNNDLVQNLAFSQDHVGNLIESAKAIN